MNQFRNILYVAEAPVSQAATIARAVSLAQNNQAALTVMDVVPPVMAIGLPHDAPIPDELQASLVAERRQALESLLEPYRQTLDIRLDMAVGKAFLEVIRAVLRHDYDLVIKPAEDPAWLPRLFGSEDMHLLRKCPCPVWLMKPDEKSNYACIMAALDFDPDQAGSPGQALNRQILDLASSLALSDFATLHLLHVWDAPAEMLLRTWNDKPEQESTRYMEAERSRHQAGVEQLQEILRESLGAQAYAYLAPQYHSLQGSAKILIPQMALQLQADLVVMGTVARSGIPGFFIGNTAEEVLDQLRCSVLALKPPGFVSPVHADGQA